MVHCWKGFTDEDGNDYTCLLEQGHDGLHCLTPDTEITLDFANADEAVDHLTKEKDGLPK